MRQVRWRKGGGYGVPCSPVLGVGVAGRGCRPRSSRRQPPPPHARDVRDTDARALVDALGVPRVESGAACAAANDACMRTACLVSGVRVAVGGARPHVRAPVQAPSQLRVRDACDVDTAPEASGCGAAAQPSLAGRGRGGRRRPPLSSSPSSWRSSVRHRDDAAPRDVDNDCGYAAVLLCRTVCLSRKVQGFYHSTAPNRSRRIRARKWGLVGPSPPRENPLIMKYTLASGATNEATTIVTRNLDHNNPPDD